MSGGRSVADLPVELRKEPAILRIERPTRLDRARSIGYKAKQGVLVVRSRTTKGRTKRPKIKKGRRPKRYGRTRLSPGKSDQRIAEERASKKYPNCEVLNSYWVGQDGSYKWYEVIMVDRDHPAIKADKQLGRAAAKRGRVSKIETKTAQDLLFMNVFCAIVPSVFLL